MIRGNTFIVHTLRVFLTSTFPVFITAQALTCTCSSPDTDVCSSNPCTASAMFNSVHCEMIVNVYTNNTIKEVTHFCQEELFNIHCPQPQKFDSHTGGVNTACIFISLMEHSRVNDCSDMYNNYDSCDSFL